MWLGVVQEGEVTCLLLSLSRLDGILGEAPHLFFPFFFSNVCGYFLKRATSCYFVNTCSLKASPKHVVLGLCVFSMLSFIPHSHMKSRRCQSSRTWSFTDMQLWNRSISSKVAQFQSQIWCEWGFKLHDRTFHLLNSSFYYWYYYIFFALIHIPFYNSLLSNLEKGQKKIASFASGRLQWGSVLNSGFTDLPLCLLNLARTEPRWVCISVVR